jgi:aminodeoxyfutalosine deaminase
VPRGRFRAEPGASQSHHLVLRARIVLPVSGPLLSDGAVAILGNRIIAVGSWRNVHAKFGEPSVDLGDVIMLPGLVNAHCHLDYTGMAGKITPPKSFSDWIKSLLELKADWSYSDYAQSWLQGAKMLRRRGVTTVADIEAVPELLPEVWSATPLRVFSFLEMTGVRSRRLPKDILRETADVATALPEGNWVGLSPHAPYSTTPELLELTAELCRKRRWRVTTHLSESAAEFEMFVSRRGALFDWLKKQRNTADCGLGSPVQHLDRHGLLGDNLLAVHVNYLSDGDAELLARRHVSVVHCPRSHGYFQHQPFPCPALRKAGVNICLGTDSLVSVKKKRGQSLELDMFAEMRSLSANQPSLSNHDLLEMATVKGAHALGLSGRVGELTESAFADLIAIPFSGDAKGADEAVVHHSGDVSASMIGGRWVLWPGRG